MCQQRQRQLALLTTETQTLQATIQKLQVIHTFVCVCVCVCCAETFSFRKAAFVHRHKCHLTQHHPPSRLPCLYTSEHRSIRSANARGRRSSPAHPRRKYSPAPASSYSFGAGLYPCAPAHTHILSLLSSLPLSLSPFHSFSHSFSLILPASLVAAVFLPSTNTHIYAHINNKKHPLTHMQALAHNVSISRSYHAHTRARAHTGVHCGYAAQPPSKF